MLKVMITGYDKRSEIIKKYLSENLKNVDIYSYENTVDCDTKVVILPVPCTLDGITINYVKNTTNIADFFGLIPEKAIIIGAGFKNDRVFDLCDRDDFSYLNAIPTAEGAIELAIKNTDTTLFLSNILITGFGRVSKLLADRLLSFKGKISIAARKSGDKAFIKALGAEYIPINELDNYINRFDIVFNTVPYKLFGDKTLKNSKENSLFMELASREAGFDKEAIKKYNIRYINAPGLPGKCAPRTAGEIMAETIINLLNENNLC